MIRSLRSRRYSAPPPDSRAGVAPERLDEVRALALEMETIVRKIQATSTAAEKSPELGES